MNYKQSHKTQYVSVPKILKALETLKKLGNKYYQFVPDYETFKHRCRETDTDGFNFLFHDEEEEKDGPDSCCKTMGEPAIAETEKTDAADDKKDDNGNDSDNSEAEEEEY